MTYLIRLTTAQGELIETWTVDTADDLTRLGGQMILAEIREAIERDEHRSPQS